MLPDEPPPPPRPGPFYAVRCVRAYSQAEGISRAILLALAVYADEAGYAHPSRGALEHDLGKSRSTVQRGLRALIASGEVVVLVQGNGRGHASRYRITLVRPLLTPVRDSPQDDPKGGQKGGHSDTVSERKGFIVTQKGGHSDPRTTKELPRGEGETFPDRCPVHTGTPDPPPCRGCQRVRESNAAAAVMDARFVAEQRRRRRLAQDRDAIHAPAEHATPPPPGWRTR